MKQARRRAQAQIDILDTARHYREAAGAATAQRFAQAVKAAVAQLEANPAIGSPRIGQEIGVAELRTWRLTGFPAALWYFERTDHVDVVRLIGERQDPTVVSVLDNPAV